MSKRNLFFILFNALILLAFYGPLKEMFLLSLSNDAVYSHIVLIPLISGYFIFSEKWDIFEKVKYYLPGIFIVLAGLFLYIGSHSYSGVLNENDHLSVMIMSGIITWSGGFILFYGKRALQKARFPFLFLLLIIPIPSIVLDNIIFILQKLSSEAANIFFMISGISYYHEGFTFHLSNLSVEVAEECSGIRSSLALFIGSIVAGHLFLKTSWRKVVLVLVVLPISIMRNGFRVFILSILGNYVDPVILEGNLHRKGGIPLFILSFALLMVICWFLRRSERKTAISENRMYSQISIE